MISRSVRLPAAARVVIKVMAVMKMLEPAGRLAAAGGGIGVGLGV